MAAYLLTIFSRLPSRPEGRAQWQQPVPSALAFPSTLPPTFPPPGIEPGAQPLEWCWLLEGSVLKMYAGRNRHARIVRVSARQACLKNFIVTHRHLIFKMCAEYDPEAGPLRS